MDKLIDMKMDKADLKEEQAALTTPQRDPYPYGLCLSLDTDELDKLGIKDLPEVGQEYHIMAVGKVTRVSSNAGQDGESRGISVQITMMCMDSEPITGEEKSTPKTERRERPASSVMSNSYGG